MAKTKRPAREMETNRIAGGVCALTVSSLLTKVLGLLFKIPMNRLMGDTAMGYYNAAYSIFTFFYMLSTAGIPVALSILVARAAAEEGSAQVKRVFRTALCMLIGIGAAGSAIFALFSDALAGGIGAPPAAWCIAVIAPTLFFICVASALRGYFQGLSYMVPTAVSQLIEAAGKVIIGIALGLYALRMGFSPAITAAYAVSGLTIGTALGMLYLVIIGCLHKTPSIPNVAPPQSYRRILAAFAAIALPVTLSSSVMSLTNMIDTALIQRLLQSAGMTQEAATAAYGNYTSLAVPLFNLPPVLVYPIAYAIVPAVTRFHAAGDGEKLREAVHSALKLAILIGLPCALGMSVLAEPILTLLYRADSAAVAAPLLIILAPSSFFVCLLAVTNSVLQSTGKAHLPLFSMAIGAGVKIAASVLLIPRLGIAASPIGTFLCYAVVCVCNLIGVSAVLREKLPLAALFAKPFFVSGIAVGAAFAVYTLCAPRLPLVISLGCAILTAIVLYLPLLQCSGAVGEAEAQYLPRVIAKRLWKQKENHHIRIENHGTENDTREDPRSGGQGTIHFGRPAHADRGTAQSRWMSVGQRADAPVHSQRSH